MPNIITHKIFAQRVLQHCTKQDIKTVIEKHLQLYYIGSNGPDFLFFYHMKPGELFKEHSLNHIGSELHHGHVNAFYESALESIKKEKDPFTKESELAYLLGHLTHWALDMTTHPYIFYRTGNCKKASAGLHHRFESMLDAMMLKQFYQTDIKEYRCSAICEFDREMLKAIARIYVPALQHTLHQQIRVYQLRSALESWYAIQELLYDPKDRKAKLLHKAERLIRKPWLISGNVVPCQIDSTYDITNEQKQEWCDPCDDQRRSNASFNELLEDAMTTALRVWKAAYGCVEYDADITRLFNELQDRAYDSGREGNAEMKYFNVIYDEAV